MSHALDALEAVFSRTLEQADLDGLSEEYEAKLDEIRSAMVGLADAVAEKRITPEDALKAGAQLVEGAKSLALAGALDARTKVQGFALDLIAVLFKVAVTAV